MRAPLISTLALVALSLAAPAPAEEAINGLAAVVNGKPITKSEVRNAVQAQAFMLSRQFPAGGPEFREAMDTLESDALQDLIDRELILAEFEKSGAQLKKQYLDDAIDSFIRERFEGDRSKFLEELKKIGMTNKRFREQREKMLVVQYMRAGETRNIPPPTPAERDAFFEENKDQFREKSFIKLRTITIPKYTGNPAISADDQRKLAEEIRARLVKGADFASEARTYSADSAAEKGGDRDWIDENLLNKRLTAAAFAMDEDQISDVIEDPSSFYILWVEGKQLGKLPPRDELKDTVNKLVLQQKRAAAERKWIEILRSKATIRIYD